MEKEKKVSSHYIWYPVHSCEAIASGSVSGLHSYRAETLAQEKKTEEKPYSASQALTFSETVNTRKENLGGEGGNTTHFSTSLYLQIFCMDLISF